MQKVFLILSIAFLILAFCGAGYVLYNGGRINAGYAVIPMIFQVASFQAYCRIKYNTDKGKHGNAHFENSETVKAETGNAEN